jgi:hypothetical protein
MFVSVNEYHQQNISLSLEAHWSVGELFDQNPRVDKSLCWLGRCSRFDMHHGVPAKALYGYTSSGTNQVCTWEQRHKAREWLGAPAHSLRVPLTHLGVQEKCLEVLMRSMESRQIAVEQAGKNILFWNVAGGHGNHRCHLLFNNYQNSWIQFLISAQYLCICISR